METILNQQQFDDAVKDRAVITFTAPGWCYPCQQFEPHFKAVEDRVEIPLYTLDVDKVPQDMLIDKAVLSVPSVVYYEDGKEAGRLNARTVVQLEEQINSL